MICLFHIFATSGVADATHASESSFFCSSISHAKTSLAFCLSFSMKCANARSSKASTSGERGRGAKVLKNRPHSPRPSRFSAFSRAFFLRDISYTSNINSSTTSSGIIEYKHCCPRRPCVPMAKASCISFARRPVADSQSTLSLESYEYLAVQPEKSSHESPRSSANLLSYNDKLKHVFMYSNDNTCMPHTDNHVGTLSLCDTGA